MNLGKSVMTCMLALSCLAAFSTQNAHAGIIPWTYNAIFGPPGSIAQMRANRIAYRANAGFGAPVYYGPTYYGGVSNTSFFGPDSYSYSLPTTSYYYPTTTVGFGPAVNNCCGQQTSFAPVSPCSSCGVGSPCGTSGCASGDCGVNQTFSGENTTNRLERADDPAAADVDEAADLNEGTTPPEGLGTGGQPDSQGFNDANSEYDGGDATKWPAPEMTDPKAEENETTIRNRQPAPDGIDESNLGPQLGPIQVEAKSQWRHANAPQRIVRRSSYHLPLVARNTNPTINVEQNEVLRFASK